MQLLGKAQLRAAIFVAGRRMRMTQHVSAWLTVHDHPALTTTHGDRLDGGAMLVAASPNANLVVRPRSNRGHQPAREGVERSDGVLIVGLMLDDLPFFGVRRSPKQPTTAWGSAERDEEADE